MSNTYYSSPIKSGSNVVHLSDIVVIDKLYDPSGHSLGLFLMWQIHEKFSIPLAQSNQLKIGEDYAMWGETNNDFISCVKSITNPKSCLDEIIVLKAGGAVEIYGFDFDKQTIVKTNSYAVSATQQGKYFTLGYIYDATNDSLVLPIVYQNGDDWCLQIAGDSKSYSLGWKDVGAIVGGGIGQYALNQKIYFWTHSSHGQSCEILDYNLYETKIICYGIEDLMKILLGGEVNKFIECTLESPAMIDQYRLCTDMITLKCNQNSNDEQIILRYTTDTKGNTQVISIIEPLETEKGFILSLKNSKTFSCATASAFIQKILLIQKPNKNIFLFPYFNGNGLDSYVQVVGCIFDWDNNTWIDVGTHAFAIKEVVTEHKNALVYNVGCFYRLLDPSHLDLKFFIKAISSNLGLHTANIQVISTTVTFNDSSLNFESLDLHLETLPVWCTSNDTINISPAGMHFGQHFLQCLQCDLIGDSIVYGAPKLSQELDFGQILGLYQVPPFENQISMATPQMTISFSDSKTDANNVSTHLSTFRNVHDNLSVTVFGQTISANIGQTWHDSKMKMQSNHYSTNVHSTLTVAKNDILHVNASQFNIWTYPIHQKTQSKDSLEDIVIIQPLIENTIGLYSVQDKEFVYKQDYEIGMLLSYLNANMDGYETNQLLFNPVSLPILGSGGQASLSYNETQSTMQGNTTTNNTSFNAGGSLSLGAGGKNTFWSVHDTLSYSQGSSEGTTNTTDMTLTKGFALTFTFGNVNDDIYEYEVTPLVYTDKETKIVKTKYKINLTGIGWKKYFALPNPVLFRVFPFSRDTMAQGYTRSIRFKSIDDGQSQATVSLFVFNNSLNGCDDITCVVYEGLPKTSKNGLCVDDTMKKLGTYGTFALEPATSKEFHLDGLVVARNSNITIQILSSTSLGIRDIYWGCFPYDYLGQLAESNRLKLNE